MSENLTLKDGDIIKLFFKFAIPSIFGMLIISLETMIDGIFLGRNVGAVGLAAINLSMPLINFLFSIGLMISIGGGVIASIYSGRKKYNKAYETTTLTLVLLVVVLQTLSIFIIFNLDFFIKLLGANSEAYPYVKSYLLPMMIGAFFFTSPVFTETFARIENKPNWVFISGITCLTTNVILDYLFIVKLNWGMTGGAIATLCACGSGFFALLPQLKFKKLKPKLYLYTKDIKNIFYNGSSEMLSLVASTTSVYLFNRILMKEIGVLGISAMTIIFYIYQILNTVLYGLSQALQPLVSYNLGAKDLFKINAVLKISFISGAIIGVMFYIITHLIGNNIIEIFSKGNTELIRLAGQALFYISFTFLISFLNIITTSFLTAIEKPLESIIVSLGRSIVFIVIPLFTLPKLIGSRGIWLSIPIAESLCLIVSFILMNRAKTYLHNIIER